MPRSNDPKTPLLALLRACTPTQRKQLAEQAGTSESYLYQLAGCQRTPSVSLAAAIANATLEMHKESKGKLAKISVQELATMCEVDLG